MAPAVARSGSTSTYSLGTVPTGCENPSRRPASRRRARSISDPLLGGTADPREADKRAPAVQAEFGSILDRAERIRRRDVQVCCIMACLPKADLLKPQGDEPELLKFSGHALPPEPTSPVVPFETILNSWALEHPNPKTKDYYTGKCRKLTDLLGYDDAARVTPRGDRQVQRTFVDLGLRAEKRAERVCRGENDLPVRRDQHKDRDGPDHRDHLQG